MAEEFDTDQLVEFCQRLGLAKDGYLDEKELAIVCNCIGLQAPEEMMKELFEELDTDKDGRVCLEELSQMLRGMPKNPSSPEKLKLFNDASSALSSSPLMESSSSSTASVRADFSNIPNGDRGAFSILDPQNSGFTKVGMIIDMWSQLGIGQDDGIRILKDMGFPASSRNNSINVQDLTKALEEETDNSKDVLPLVIQTALITYRTEAQYLRSVCESFEGERDKLKSDVYEAHQRSSMLAQEVDEQNARLEKNSQILLRKMEAKYTEQIHELQQKFAAEKESLQQSLQLAESQLQSLEQEDAKLKMHISKLNNENSVLERELQNLNQEIRSLNRTKSHLEKEISRYVDLENRLIEMERRSAEAVANNDGKLQKAYGEMQLLRDQNDELSSQLEGMKETVKILKVNQEKRFQGNKKRKGSRSVSSSEGPNNRMEEGNGSPLEKIGKFHRSLEANVFPDDSEELESSIDPLLTSSCSQPDSGNFPVPVSISLAACMGESSTDSPYPEDMANRIHSDDNKLASEYKTLEIEMESVKEKIVSIITEKENLIEENRCLKNELGYSNAKEEIEMEITTKLDATTQTSMDSSSVIVCEAGTSSVSVVENELIEQLRKKIAELENEASQTKTEFEKEKSELKEQCSDLENSLDLLRVEYEKCEDYWQDKLSEARDIYEQDKAATDEQFQDLAMKIRQYEEAFLPAANTYDRLPPIEERASLERQVNDLEDECEGLRKELHSVKVEQDSIITNYQRQFESKALEENGRLEQQVSALSKKCKDYENRLSSLAEEERSTLEESGMMDMLKDRVRQLEFQLKNQEEKYKYQITQLERLCRDKDEQLRRVTPERPRSSNSPQPSQPWKDENEPKKSRSLLEMLHQSNSNVESMSIWPQRYANYCDKSSSLPFIPLVEHQPHAGGWGTISNNNININNNNNHDLWVTPTVQGKKAWCHVELGWLQALRSKLKQRDEQCYTLQRILQQKDMENEKFITEMRYKHEAEVSNWEGLMHASQELVRQQAIKHKEQAEKLAHSDMLMKDLWIENSKLMAALNATEQRVLHLENLLKYQMNNQGNSQPSHTHSIGVSPMPSSPRSLQYPPHHFST